MKQEPLISVITVCYNGAATLDNAIRSVAGQNWPSVEHIVIDGGSTDATASILEHHRNSLACVVSEPDHGIYDAMNKGLDRATGDIICFLNADDRYASPNVFSQVVPQMNEHHLDALMGDVGFFRPDDPTRMVRRYRSSSFHPNRLAWGWMPAHPALFLKSEVVRRVGHFKTNYRIAGDYEFIIRAFHGRDLNYRHLPMILVHMLTGGASTSGLRATIRLNQEVLRACRENGLNTNMLKILSKYPAKIRELISR